MTGKLEKDEKGWCDVAETKGQDNDFCRGILGKMKRGQARQLKARL